MTQFSTVGLIGHLNSERAIYSIKRLIRFLQQWGICFVLEEETAALSTDVHLVEGALHIVNIDALGQTCDLVEVVAGDGSLLRGGRALAKSNVPLLGVNRARLGFLTDVPPEDIEPRVEEVLNGKYVVDNRFLLAMTVMRQGQAIGTG